jgi:uncharacterized spore protein YtfJ
MPLNKLFDTVEKVKDTASWRTAFGEPQLIDEKVIIPVARVGYGFGLGFGSDAIPDQPETEASLEDDASGAGGAAWSRPMGAIIVTPEDVYFEETVESGKIALAGIALTAFIVFLFTGVLRAFLGRRST